MPPDESGRINEVFPALLVTKIDLACAGEYRADA